MALRNERVERYPSGGTPRAVGLTPILSHPNAVPVEPMSARCKAVNGQDAESFPPAIERGF